MFGNACFSLFPSVFLVCLVLFQFPDHPSYCNYVCRFAMYLWACCDFYTPTLCENTTTVLADSNISLSNPMRAACRAIKPLRTKIARRYKMRKSFTLSWSVPRHAVSSSHHSSFFFRFADQSMPERVEHGFDSR